MLLLILVGLPFLAICFVADWIDRRERRWAKQQWFDAATRTGRKA